MKSLSKNILGLTAAIAALRRNRRLGGFGNFC